MIDAQKILRRHSSVVAVTLLGMVIGASSMWFLLTVSMFFNYAMTPQQPEILIEHSRVVFSASLPTHLSIPSVNIDTDFEEPLGVTLEKTVEVPESYDTVGWYEYSPTPGELGPSVVLGHVDSYKGPAVFHPLGKLQTGAKIFIEREDGTTVVFKVSKIEYTSQDTFPTEKVYGDINYPGLRLVTCTGVYDKGKLRYSHNLIVYATLVNSEGV